MRKRAIQERFFEKVDRGGPVVRDGLGACWIWTAATHENGYGRVSYRGKARWAHRVAWELANGKPPPAGMVVRHECDNTKCVNPDHLLLGTHADNSADRGARGRTHRRKGLTAIDGERIRALVRGGGARQSIADEYGVSRSYVDQIVRGEWLVT